MDLQQKVLSVFEQIGLPAKERLVVAVSGGADSLALLYLTYQHFDVTAITVNHGLRTEAKEEAEYVAQVCRDIGVRHVTLDWKGDKPSANLQAEARDARYELMENWCLENDVGYLATAHQKNDQAETFLLRLARGSGVTGLSGIAPLRKCVSGIKLLRPLLNVHRKELENFLSSKKVKWVNDPSNLSEVYNRVKTRKLLENPFLEGLNVDRLAETASRMLRAKDALSYYEEQWLQHAVVDHGFYIVLSTDSLKNAPEEIVLRGLSSICRTIGGNTYGPRIEKLERLLASLHEPDFLGKTLLGCKFASIRKNSVLVCREARNIKGETPVLQRGTWDGRFAYTASENTEELTISSVGEDGFLYLKKHWEHFSQVTIPRDVVVTLPAIYHRGDLRAVPHIGYDTLTSVEISFSLVRSVNTKK